MSVPNVLKSRRFVTAVVGLVVILLSAATPALEEEFQTIATSVVIIVGVLVGGYSAEDVQTAKHPPTS